MYLDTSRSSDELYHEDYKYVAVMFASIPDYMDQYYSEHDDNGLECLEVLNQIVSGFDAVRIQSIRTIMFIYRNIDFFIFQLSFEGPFSRIEKIKLVGSTYMAACGLSANKRSVVHHGSLAGIITDDGSSTSETNSETAGPSGSCLAVTVRFVAAMTAVLDRINAKHSQHFQLRTGIDYGPVIAGVVGAQKPLYDIWGDTVNMASRLEHTGELGRIQVTEKTARLIESEGIHCERRGRTFLKGKGTVVTYWVHPDRSSFVYDAQQPTGRLSTFSASTPEVLLLPAILGIGLPESCLTCPSRNSCAALSSSRPRSPLPIPEEDEQQPEEKIALPDIEDFCTRL